MRYTFSETERFEASFEPTLQTQSGSDRLRCELEQKLSARLRLKPRLDLIRPRHTGFAAATNRALGVALSLDVLCQLTARVTLNFRETHFDSRWPLYHYERDLPGVFTVVALRERGRRRYIYGQFKLHPKFSLAGKISSGEAERLTSLPRANFAWGLQLDWTIR